MLLASRFFRTKNSRRGLTVVELLVVVAILVILISLGFLAVKSVRESAQGAKCVGNLRQVMMVTQQYAVENNGRVLYYYYDETKTSGIESWWRLEFRKREYLGKTGMDEAAYCPSLPVNKSAPSECYGMRAFNPPGEWPEGFINSNTLNDQNQRQVDIWIVLNRIARPSAYPLYADSANITATGVLRQWHRFSTNPAATGSSYGGVHLRHGRRANVAFLDGHVESLSPEGLKEHGILSGYDNAGKWMPFND